MVSTRFLTTLSNMLGHASFLALQKEKGRTRRTGVVNREIDDVGPPVVLDHELVHMIDSHPRKLPVEGLQRRCMPRKPRLLLPILRDEDRPGRKEDSGDGRTSLLMAQRVTHWI